jgi:hypothetical protein
VCYFVVLIFQLALFRQLFVDLLISVGLNEMSYLTPESGLILFILGCLDPVDFFTDIPARFELLD